MKRWSLIVAVLYGLVLLALLGPVIWVCFIGRKESGQWTAPSMKDMADLYLAWQSWTVIGVLALAQWALLRVPVDFESRRPARKGSLMLTVAAAGFAMGLLVFGVLTCVYEVVTKLNGDKGWNWVLLAGVASWVFWSVYFYRKAQRAAPDAGLTAMTSLLRKGSILELLIAVPCHVYVRHRNECCAGLGTFMGLACGISVMLFAFGPAVGFLVAERLRRKAGAVGR